jgi:hypothetical protein
MSADAQDINDEEDSAQHTEQCEWHHQASKVSAGSDLCLLGWWWLLQSVCHALGSFQIAAARLLRFPRFKLKVLNL